MNDLVWTSENCNTSKTRGQRPVVVAGAAPIRRYASNRSKHDAIDMYAKQLAKLGVIAAFDRQRLRQLQTLKVYYSVWY